jgi:hypothetical protein
MARAFLFSPLFSGIALSSPTYITRVQRTSGAYDHRSERYNMSAPDRVMRILKYSFVFSGLLFAFVAMQIPAQNQRPPEHMMETVIVLLALLNVAAGFLVQHFPTLIAGQSPRPGTALSPVSRWMSTNLVSLACFEACILFGLILHMLGARTRIVQLLIATGIIAMLIWRPATAPAAEQVGSRSS